MDRTIHGEAKTLHHDSLTVTELLDVLGVGQRRVAIERNRRGVPRARHEITRRGAARARHEITWVSEGDVIEVVCFVGGRLRGLRESARQTGQQRFESRLWARSGVGECASARVARQPLDASEADNEATQEGAPVLLAARAPPGVGRLEHLRRVTKERGQDLIVVAPRGLDAAVGADGVGLPEHGGRVVTGREMSPMLVVVRSRHDRDDHDRAQRERASWATLSPLSRPRSKPHARSPLGAAEFSRNAEGLSLPVVP